MKDMIKIGKKPRIVQNGNRWGGLENGFYVNSTSGYIRKEYWSMIKEFESAQLNGDINKVTSLLKYSGGYRLWQMNLLTKHIDNEDSEYVRTFALLGEKTLYKWTILDDIYTAYLKVKCSYKNRIY